MYKLTKLILNIKLSLLVDLNFHDFGNSVGFFGIIHVLKNINNIKNPRL